MDPKIAEELKQKEPSQFHSRLLQDCLAMIKRSRAERSKNYPSWDLQDEIFRGERWPDREDEQMRREGKPEKLVVPNTFSQVMTFVSFLFLLFKQNQRFFTLSATGDEDYGTKQADSETLLEGDLQYNEFDTKLFQFLLDIGRFGHGILEDSWTEEKVNAWIVPEPTTATVNGIEVPGAPQEGSFQEFIKYEGTAIKSVSPFRFFPDTSFPLVDFQKGRFCAVEEEYTIGELRKLERAGEVVGVDHIEPLHADWAKNRGADTRWSFRDSTTKPHNFDMQNDNSTVLVTKLQLKLIPSSYVIGPDDEKMGPHDFEILYHVWYANDNRIIRCEPCRWWHNEFSYSVSQFTPDQQRQVNLGLADLIGPLQDVVSWLVNSHITSVRRVIASRLIVDPKLIDTKTLDGDGDIYLKKSVSVPIERTVGQIKVQDVTQNHMTDSELLTRTMEQTSGVNNNMTGQYNTGRRSAQESRVVTAGAAGRMKTHGHLIWTTGPGRLGRHMHANQRQSLSFETFQRRIGTGRPNANTGETAEQNIARRYVEFRGTPADVIAGQDYFIFDSTLSSEKGFIAQSLQELLVAVMSNPQVAVQWDLSAQAMLEEIQRLRGAGNISRFSLSRRIAAGQEALPAPTPLPSPNGQSNQEPTARTA